MKSLFLTFLSIFFIPLTSFAQTKFASFCQEISKLQGFSEAHFKGATCRNKLEKLVGFADWNKLCSELDKIKSKPVECELYLATQEGGFGLHFYPNDVILKSPVVMVEQQSPMMVRCLGVDPDCYMPAVKLDLVEQIASFVLRRKMENEPLRKGEDPCGCIRDIVRNSALEKGIVDFDEYEKKSLKKLNDVIYFQASRNFLNDFSSYLEDASFFKLSETKEDAFNLCPNTHFEMGVSRKCKERGIDPSVQMSRMESVFGAYGDEFTGEGIQGKFDRLRHEVLTMPKENPELGPSRRIPRKLYDVVRRNSRNEPEFILFKKLFQETDKDKKVKRMIDDHLASGKKPLEAFHYLLFSGELDKVLESMVKGEGLPPILQELKTAMQTKEKVKIQDFWSIHLRKMFNVMPASKYIFGDSEMFKKFMEESGDKDIQKYADMNQDNFNIHMERKCEILVHKFSELICTRDDDYKKFATREDIKQIVSPLVMSNEMRELLLCSHEDNLAINSPFKKLALGNDQFLQSDYQDRVLNKDRSTNGFSAFVKSATNPENSIAKEYIKDKLLADKDIKFTKSETSAMTMLNLHSPSMDRFRVAKDEIMTEALLSEEKSLESISQFKEVRERPVEKEGTEPPAIFQMPAYSSTLAPVAVAATDASNGKDKKTVSRTPASDSSWKEDLMDFLSKNEEKRHVENLMAGARDEDLQEILRLKKQLAQDNQAMLKSMYELEKEKLKMMEKEFRSIESEYGEKQVASPAVRKSGESEFRDENHDFASARKLMNTSGVNGGGTENILDKVSSAPSRSAESSVSSGGAAAQASSRASSSSAGGADSARVESGYLVVSGGLRAEDPKDISSELIKFINEKNPDIETLKKIRESKLLYQYMLSKDGKNLSKEIIFEYEALNAEARKLLEARITQQTEMRRLEESYQNARRTYSVSALKLLLLSRMLN